MLKIYHNNRCSKSRQTLELLREQGQEPKVIEYLKDAPTVDELRDVLDKLGLKPEQIVRKGEQVYKEQYAGKSLTDDEWLEALAANPILMERPIVVTDGKAAIGRPPEHVLTIL